MLLFFLSFELSGLCVGNTFPFTRAEGLCRKVSILMMKVVHFNCHAKVNVILENDLLWFPGLILVQTFKWC